MQHQKRYWLRGGIVGFLIYLIILFYYIIFIIDWRGAGASIVTTELIFFFLPIILVGLLAGWIYGKIKNRKKVWL